MPCHVKPDPRRIATRLPFRYRMLKSQYLKPLLQGNAQGCKFAGHVCSAKDFLIVELRAEATLQGLECDYQLTVSKTHTLTRNILQPHVSLI